MLELVNGKNTVKDIVRQSRMGSFDVSKMLFRLLSIKLIRRRVAARRGVSACCRRARRRRRRAPRWRSRRRSARGGRRRLGHAGADGAGATSPA